MTSLATTVLADSWGWHHGDVGIGWWIVMMLGMVIVGAFVGYQWLMSGLTKIVRGGFRLGPGRRAAREVRRHPGAFHRPHKCREQLIDEPAAAAPQVRRTRA